MRVKTDKVKTKVVTIRLPADHPVFLLPEGRRSKFIRERLTVAPVKEYDYGLVVEAIREAVREAIKEELTRLSIAPANGHSEGKPAVNPAELKADILSVLG